MASWEKLEWLNETIVRWKFLHAQVHRVLARDGHAVKVNDFMAFVVKCKVYSKCSQRFNEVLDSASCGEGINYKHALPVES